MSFGLADLSTPRMATRSELVHAETDCRYGGHMVFSGRHTVEIEVALVAAVAAHGDSESGVL